MERDLLTPVLAPWLAGPIEHVGSTAVPGLAAKPVIDIMAAVHGLEASRPAIEALSQVGYLYAPYMAEVLHWFCKPSPDMRTHHLHLVPFGSRLWNDRILFRNRLISSVDLANEYAALKRRLASQHTNDRDAYTDAKGPFIEEAIRRG